MLKNGMRFIRESMASASPQQQKKAQEAARRAQWDKLLKLMRSKPNDNQKEG